MSDAKQAPLVSCEWLREQLERGDMAVLDATFFLPAERRDAAAEYRQCHLPGARFFDIDAVADHNTPLPHMLPSPAEFAEAVGGLGIGNDTLVVAYDNNRFMASARLWWTLRVFGHERVVVLDGGLQRWQALGLPVAAGSGAPAPRVPYQADFHPELVCDLAQMRLLAASRGRQLLDARSPGRFEGRDPEPRPGLKSGHIPGSHNLFFADLLDPDSRTLRSVDELAQLFRQAGVDPALPVVTTCGTGVTAAVLALALYRLGREDVAVYDGSWSEWGGLPDTPVVTGTAV